MTNYYNLVSPSLSKRQNMTGEIEIWVRLKDTEMNGSEMGHIGTIPNLEASHPDIDIKNLTSD